MGQQDWHLFEKKPTANLNKGNCKANMKHFGYASFISLAARTTLPVTLKKLLAKLSLRRAPHKRRLALRSLGAPLKCLKPQEHPRIKSEGMLFLAAQSLRQISNGRAAETATSLLIFLPHAGRLENRKSTFSGNASFL